MKTKVFPFLAIFLFSLLSSIVNPGVAWSQNSCSGAPCYGSPLNCDNISWCKEKCDYCTTSNDYCVGSPCNNNPGNCDLPVCAKCHMCSSDYINNTNQTQPTGSQNPKDDTILTEPMEGKIGNPVIPNIITLTGTSFLQKILRTGIVMTLITGSIVFFFILTSGGIKWLSSSGDKVKLESAQKQISSGLVGLAILLSSFAIIKLIEVLFGIDLLNFTLPTL